MGKQESPRPFEEQIKTLEAALTDAKKKLETTQDEAGAYEGLLNFAMQDMRRIYDELMQSQARLMQADKLATVGLLTAGVAHELNHQLTVMSMVFSLLRIQMDILRSKLKVFDAKAGESIQEMDGLIKKGTASTENTTRIANDIRVFSRSDKGLTEPHDLNEILESVLHIARHAMKNAELKKEYGVLPPVPCNAQQIGQVFLNLLVNASQAIKERGVITLKSYTADGNVRVEIRDTGLGISPENFEKIFEPFFTTKAAESGTGLGLSICRDIVQRHGGTIRVESATGKGSVFTVSFPIQAK